MLFSHRHRAGLGPVATPSSHPRRPATLRLLAVAGCALLGNGAMALPRPAAAWGQTVSAATVTEVLDSDQVFIQNQRAAVNSVAQRQQRVRTQAARASLRFNNGAVARLAHHSSLMVGQCAQLNRGTLLVNGSLNGCSTTTVAGVRGTIYTLEVTEEGETIVKVFEGEVIVAQRTDAVDPGPPVDLEDGLLEEDGLDSHGLGEDGLGENGLDHPETSIPSPQGSTPESSRAGTKQTADPTGQPDDNAIPGAESPNHTNNSDDSGDPFGVEMDPSPTDTGDPPDAPPETVEFNPDTVLVIDEGQQVTVNAENDEAEIRRLTAEDFINLLEGPLIQGFLMDIPGISDLQRVFQQRFPGIPQPPGLPSMIIPLPPIRFPY